MPPKRPPQTKHAYPRPAPVRRRGRQRGLQKEPEPTPALDAAMMPHIFDRIVELAPHASLIALRGVSRPLRERVDARLAGHIVLRPSVAYFKTGVYIHSLGQRSPEPHAPVGADIALPGFAFVSENERRPYSTAVQEREARLALMCRPPPSLPVQLLHEQEEAAERKRRRPHTARAAEWCEAALVHTRAIDLLGFAPNDIPVLLSLEKQLPNLEVVRFTRSLVQRLPLPESPHIITSINTWGVGRFYTHNPTDTARTLTMFVNVHAGCNSFSAYVGCPPLGRLRHITVVFRAVPATACTDSAPQVILGRLGILRWHHGVEALRTGVRFTYVNISKETQSAVGMKLDDDQGAEGGYEAAFMRALEHDALQAHQLQPYMTDEQLELVRRGVRVLSMGEWMAEACADDREACSDFW